MATLVLFNASEFVLISFPFKFILFDIIGRMTKKYINISNRAPSPTRWCYQSLVKVVVFLKTIFFLLRTEECTRF